MRGPLGRLSRRKFAQRRDGQVPQPDAVIQPASDERAGQLLGNGAARGQRASLGLDDEQVILDGYPLVASHDDRAEALLDIVGREVRRTTTKGGLNRRFAKRRRRMARKSPRFGNSRVVT